MINGSQTFENLVQLIKFFLRNFLDQVEHGRLVQEVLKSELAHSLNTLLFEALIR